MQFHHISLRYRHRNDFLLLDESYKVSSSGRTNVRLSAIGLRYCKYFLPLYSILTTKIAQNGVDQQVTIVSSCSPRLELDQLASVSYTCRITLEPLAAFGTLVDAHSSAVNLALSWVQICTDG